MQEKQGDTGQRYKILYVMNNFWKCKNPAWELPTNSDRLFLEELKFAKCSLKYSYC